MTNTGLGAVKTTRIAKMARIAKIDASRISFWVPVEVRYSDLDAQGHVNNATFFTYFEQGRVAFFAELRARHRAAAEASANSLIPGTHSPDLPFVLASATCSYLRPITSLTPVIVGVRSSRITHAAIEMEYAVCNQLDGILYAAGTTRTVSIDPASGRPRALPNWARLALEQLP
ncbi:MAG: acyl-CoA thioesterase [Ktedonobacterales bacterium]